MGRFVALLRGVNVGGQKKVPMADLRLMAQALGLSEVRTLIASGNLIFQSDQDAVALEAKLERAIPERFGFPVSVMVRSAQQWSGCCAANPFPEESAAKPNLVLVTVGKQAPTQADVEILRARAWANEKVEIDGGALWLWFGDGAGRSKLSVAALKGVWTTRNWRSALALRDMLGTPE
jgi:uncharacterized protein (DUF1697 family)